MAHNNLQLNYDELTSIAKQFKDQGEDIARLHAQTRQRVRDLYKEWEGEAAEKFFDEMETLLLPAVQRLAQALFLTQDTTGEIMKIIREADEDTVGFFRNQLGGGDDFGAGKFGEAVQGLGSSSSGGADDFGAGKFGEVVGAQPPGGSAPDDFGAGKFGEVTGGDSSSGDAGPSGGSSSSEDGGGGGGGSDRKPKEKETPEVETEPTSGGGGGGGSSSSSEGLKGDLKKMGTGLSDVVGQNASSGGGSGGPASMPDHVYSSESSPKPDAAPTPNDTSKPGVDTGSGDSGRPQGGSTAAGAAGAAGAAAAGGAAKAVKGKAKKNNG
jgi:WXG100 family type VII secretion target